MFIRAKALGLPLRVLSRFWLWIIHRGNVPRIYWHLDAPLGSAISKVKNPVRMAGWIYNEKGQPPHKVFVKVGDRTIPLPARLPRQDVLDKNEEVPELDVRTGFEGSFRLGKGIKLLQLFAEWEDGTQCLLCRRLYWTTSRLPKSLKRVNRKRHKLRNQVLLSQYRKQCAEHSGKGGEKAQVDVIIPVYKGLEETRKCLDSIYQSIPENQTQFDIIVINDASPEKDLVRYLEKEADQGKIILFHNKGNQGFVATVNRGLCFHPQRHVILLNNDTEVFHDWADRLLQPLLSQSKIATVTPFSNNATICSYPTIAEDNSIPFNTTPAALDQLCRELNSGVTHEIPTGVGFCMAMNRKCLHDIGYFDEELFGKGYGEENDYCQRAILEGWKNLHLCDTFVYHKGSVSFQETKSPRIDQAIVLINNMFPGYNYDIQKFLVTDPARENRLSIDMARLDKLPTERILCISNSRSGGTLQNIIELAQQKPNQGRLLLGSRKENPDLYHLYLLPGNEKVNYSAGGISIFDLPDYCKQWGIALLEYHQLADQTPEIMNLPSKTSIPYSFIAHDYFTFCPQIVMVTKKGTFCGLPSLEECEQCLKNSPVQYIDSVQTWRQKTQKFLTGADKIHTPSKSAQGFFTKVFPDLEFEVVPHQETNPELLVVEPKWTQNAGTELTVAVLGALSIEKGADYLEAAAVDAAARKLPINFTLVGYGYRTLQSRPKAKLKVSGRYHHRDVLDLLKQYNSDVIWFPARCPETYSYTLSQAIAGGYPIVAPDLGAFPERLQNRKLSLILPWNLSVTEVNDRILAWRSQTTIS